MDTPLIFMISISVLGAFMCYMGVIISILFDESNQMMNYILYNRLAWQERPVQVGYNLKKNSYYLYKKSRYKQLKYRHWYGKVLSYKDYYSANNAAKLCNEEK